MVFIYLNFSLLLDLVIIKHYYGLFRFKFYHKKHILFHESIYQLKSMYLLNFHI
jgi:hypothetical protein